jgi:uncharacterized protein (DUF1778 family)
MKTKNQKTAAVTFKTTPEKKEALAAAAKAAGMDLSPYIEQQLELLSDLLNSEKVKALFENREQQTAPFLSREGIRVYVTLESVTDVLRYYLGVDESYARVMSELLREGRYLYHFASPEERAKIAKEDEEERKNSTNNGNKSENATKDSK